MASSRRSRSHHLDIWPGFVDALSTLLMSITFLLMIYVVAQFFLNQAIVGRDEALERLNGQVSELAKLLSLERKENSDLRLNLSQLTDELQASVNQRDDLRAQTGTLSLRAEQAEREAREATRQTEEAFRTMMADKDRIEVQVRELEKLSGDVVALQALKAELERKIAEMAGRVEAAEAESGEKARRLLEEQDLSASARAQVALLNQQMAALREQIGQLTAMLETSEKLNAEQKVQISNLGQRLNAALATKVQELSRYRSEFFGRLREILGERSDVRIVGDRFVFQAEVLFDTGSAELGVEGRVQIAQLAAALKEISSRIPTDIDWILQINGHTDKRPISTPQFPSNWELSSGRAISVLRVLLAEGIPAGRLAAAGFGEFQPIETRDDEIAFRRNRRIEFKLTER